MFIIILKGTQKHQLITRATAFSGVLLELGADFRHRVGPGPTLLPAFHALISFPSNLLRRDLDSQGERVSRLQFLKPTYFSPSPAQPPTPIWLWGGGDILQQPPAGSGSRPVPHGTPFLSLRPFSRLIFLRPKHGRIGPSLDTLERLHLALRIKGEFFSAARHATFRPRGPWPVPSRLPGTPSLPLPPCPQPSPRASPRHLESFALTPHDAREAFLVPNAVSESPPCPAQRGRLRPHGDHAHHGP